MFSQSKAFTLVELIVVIAILAILGTIAFIAIGDTSMSARNTAILSNMKQLSTLIGTKSATDILPQIFVVRNSSIENSTGSVFSGRTISPWVNYFAGFADLSRLGISQGSYSDSKGEILKIGTAVFPFTGVSGVRTLRSEYQIGGYMYNKEISPKFSVLGTYRQDIQQDLTTLFASGSMLAIADAWTIPADPKNLFSSGSTWVTSWSSNTCTPASIAIVNVPPGTDTLPATLADNTIYMLDEGEYRTSSWLVLANCIAIVGKGPSKTTIGYFSWSNTWLGILGADAVSRNGWVIMTGFKLDGQLSTGRASFWRYQWNTGKSTTVNIEATRTDYPIHQRDGYIGNIVAYWNTTGVTIGDGAYPISGNNIVSHSNGGDGVTYSSSQPGTTKLSRVISYNNGGRGIQIQQWAIDSFISFNNASHGLFSAGYTVTINNGVLFNNALYWVYFDEFSVWKNNYANSIVMYNNWLGWFSHGSYGSTSRNIYSYNNQWPGIRAYPFGVPSNYRHYDAHVSYGNTSSDSYVGSWMDMTTPGLASVGWGSWVYSLATPIGYVPPTTTSPGTHMLTLSGGITSGTWDYSSRGRQTGIVFSTGALQMSLNPGVGMPLQVQPVSYGTSLGNIGTNGVDFDTSKQMGVW